MHTTDSTTGAVVVRPKHLRRRLTRTLAATCAGAVLMLGAAAPADASGFTNHTQSASGAYLQSTGVCGGAFSFTIRSTGFEWLRVGVVTSRGTSWGAWSPVPHHTQLTIPLAAQYQNVAWVVQGWDLQGWGASPVVRTWFHRLTNGDNYGTWYC